MNSATLHIRLLGGVHLTQDEQPVSGFASRKAEALLIYLACIPRPLPRETLATLLWPENDQNRALANLSVVLTSLRKQLGDVVVADRYNIRFNQAAPYWLDVLEFEQGVFRARSQDPGKLNRHSATQLEKALALYQGPFLNGFNIRQAPEFENWVWLERDRLQQIAITALDDLVSYYEQRGQYQTSFTHASRLLTIDSLREETYRHLMRLYALDGQRAAALRHYEQCITMLEQELGVSPTLETVTLYEQIRAGTLAEPRLDTTTPYPQAAAATHNLPVPATSFVGREAELDRITAWFNDPHSRLLTITGTGGAGKTRLAQQAAYAHLNDFAHGVWYVSLVSLTNPSDLIVTIAETIHCPLPGATNPRHQLIAFLHEREILLILDNFEHLLAQVDLAFLTELLTQAPQVKVIITSRERLNLQAETLLELGGLPYPEGHAAAPSSSAAMQLFIDRATRLRPDFDSAGQEAALIQLCQQVDGLPLALELAASWLRTMPLTDIVQEVSRNLDFLAIRAHDLPARHRSVRAVFDYSWQLLTPEEQRVYTQLAVLRSGFTRAAAQAIAAASLPVLFSLIDKSFLRLDEDGRYRRHPLLIQFAAEHLAADPAQNAAAQARHAHFFSQMAAHLEGHLLGGQPERALPPWQADLENIKLAWQWGVAHRDVSVINAIADALMQAMDLLGLYHTARDMAFAAATAFTDQTSLPQLEGTVALGRTLGLAAAFLFRLGEYEQAMQYSRESLAVLEPIQPHIAYGHSLIYQGAAAFGLGDVAQVIRSWQAALAAYQAAGSLWGQTVAASNLAEAMTVVEDWSQAEVYARQGYELAQKMQNNELMAGALRVLANIALTRRHLDEAAQYATEALNRHRQIGHQAHIANSLSVLGTIASEQGEHETALGYLEESVKILRELDNQLYLAQGLLALAQAAAAIRDSQRARAALIEVLQVAVKTRATDVGLKAAAFLAELYEQAGNTALSLWINEFTQRAEIAAADWQMLLTRLQQSVPLPPLPVRVGERFQHEELLAEGGMGQIYRGRDTHTGQWVAIKRLRPDLIRHNPAVIARFRREGDVLRQLNHPYIVKIIEAIEAGDEYLLVMEYVPGGSLEERLTRQQTIPQDEAITITKHLVSALAHAHDLNILHRDIKPSNVLLAKDGSPRLTDFGVARLIQRDTRLTQTGTMIGTFAYMSPEACRGAELDARSDIWSLGVMLYEMLTGHSPFAKEQPVATLSAILHDVPPPLTQFQLDAAAPLADLLHHLLQKDPALRPATMHDVQAYLEALS